MFVMHDFACIHKMYFKNQNAYRQNRHVCVEGTPDNIAWKFSQPPGAIDFFQMPIYVL